MAHHLAEVMAHADAATGAEKADADARAADLIQWLWAKRRSLPAQADPLGGYREAIAVLRQLMPDRNPWAAYAGRHGEEGLLKDLFDAMARVVVGGVLLTTTRQPREASAAERAALEREERSLQKHLAWWMNAVRPPLPNSVHVVFVPAEGPQDVAGEVRGDAAADSAPTKIVEDETSNETTDEDLRRQVVDATLENLETMRRNLDALLLRWRERLERDDDPTDEDG